jgi:hypothetical protein
VKDRLTPEARQFLSKNLIHLLLELDDQNKATTPLQKIFIDFQNSRI